MGFKKCPRCELNYILDTEKYCKVCMRELRGEEIKEEIETCTICNDAPAIPGKDVCLFCLKEMAGDATKRETPAAEEDGANLDTAETLDDDIIPEIEEDIPEDEYQEITSDLSLEEMEEDESREDENTDEDM